MLCVFELEINSTFRLFRPTDYFFVTVNCNKPDNGCIHLASVTTQKHKSYWDNCLFGRFFLQFLFNHFKWQLACYQSAFVIDNQLVIIKNGIGSILILCVICAGCTKINAEPQLIKSCGSWPVKFANNKIDHKFKNKVHAQIKKKFAQAEVEKTVLLYFSARKINA